MKRVIRFAVSFVLTVSTLFFLAPFSFSASGYLQAGDDWVNYRAEEYSDYYHRELTIHTAEELALFAYDSNAGLCNFLTVTLANDICRKALLVF